MRQIVVAQDQGCSERRRDQNNSCSMVAVPLLIEKDFQCLHSDERNPSDDADAFPNPSAGDQGRETVR
jgi:hypothetical protein